MSRRGVRLISSAALAAVVCGSLAAAGASATAVPDPCSLVPATTVATTVGLHGVMLTGTLSSRPDGRVTQRLCTYTHGTTKIEIGVAPHQPNGGSGGPPGMVHVVPTGLGAGATDYYDLNPKYPFANVAFTKDDLDFFAYDSGTISNAHIVALAHLVDKAVT